MTKEISLIKKMCGKYTSFLSDVEPLVMGAYLHDPIWTIEPEYVSWPEAWEALKAGKKIKVDGVVYIYERKYQTFGEKVLKAIYDIGEGATTKYWTTLAISWLDRTDFIILED